MKDKYILVFGACSLDCTFIQNADKTYPNTPTSSTPGGKGANQAVAASRAGARVKIITRLGNDEIGKFIINNLKKNKVDTSFIELENNLINDHADVYISHNGDNDIHRQSGAINSFYVDMIEKYADIIKNASFVIAQYKIPKEVSIALINFCHNNNVPIVITPCRPERLSVVESENIDLINKITYLTCNEKEAKIVFNNDNIEDIVKKYPNKVIVTLGEKGAIYNDGVKNLKIPAFKVSKVVDTTGAGDTLNGNFVASLLKGNSIKTSLYRGMAASSIKIQTKTAQAGMPTKKELDAFINSLEKTNI